MIKLEEKGEADIQIRKIPNKLLVNTDIVTQQVKCITSAINNLLK